MPHLRIACLGPIQVTIDHIPITRFYSTKAQALLAYLSIEAERPQSRELLCGLFWPDQPEPAARRNLRQTLFQLAKTIRNDDIHALTVTRQTVQFNVQCDHWFDVAEFQGHLDKRALEPAVALYAGKFLEGLYLDDCAGFEEWMLVTREQLHSQTINALYRLTQSYYEEADYPQAQLFAQRQLSLDPWREEAYQQLMLSLAQQGQRSAAIAQYDKCCRILDEELGVPPTAATTELYTRIRAGQVAARPPESTDTTGPPAHNLPAPATPLVGREREVADIEKQLAEDDCRLLTLVGLGGVGKTRLAVSVARQQVGSATFPHGTYFISLAGLDTSQTGTSLSVDSIQQAIVFEIAAILGCDTIGTEDPLHRLLSYLRQKEILLVLDNCEHLRGATRLFSTILAAAPHVKILTTSREPLDLREEWLYRLEGLAIPSASDTADLASSSSVQLFVQCARRAQAQFKLNDENRAAVEQICRYVEGLPLGIELAASWLRALRCVEIAAAIERDIDLLATPVQNIPDRHRSMRAVFDYSWRMLSANERKGLAQIAVFHAGFSLDAALSITDVSILQLTTLAAKSLLLRAPSSRFHMHELLRQLAAQKQNEMDPEEIDALRQSHSRYFLELVSNQDFTAIRTELDNVRAAWLWAVEHKHVDHLSQGCEGLAGFFENAGLNREGIRSFSDAVLAVQTRLGTEILPERATQRVLAQLLIALGHFLVRQSEYHQAIDLTRQAVALAQASHALDLEAASHQEWGWALVYQGRDEEASAHFSQALDLARQLESPQHEIRSLIGLTASYHARSHYAETKSYLQRALDLSRLHNISENESAILTRLGSLYEGEGDHEKAKECYQEALSLLRQSGRRRGEASLLNNLGVLYDMQGDHMQARAHFEQALAINRDFGDRFGEASILGNYGISADYIGDYEAAVIYTQQAVSIHRQIDAARHIRIGMANLSLHSHHLGDNEAAQIYAEEALLIAQQSGDRYIAAYVCTVLGHALAEQDQLDEAAQAYEQSLTLLRALDLPHLAPEPLAGLARVSARQQGGFAASLGYTEEIMSYLEQALLVGTEEPFRIYLTCYQVLAAHRDARAPTVLHTAYHLLQDKAEQITDPQIRRSFLANVAAHREIIAAYEVQIDGAE